MSEAKEEAKMPEPTEQVEELTNDLKRLQAEFENYRKRVERDREADKTFARKDVLLKFLTVLDNFELALKTSPNDEFAKGVELIYAQFVSVLEAEGLKEVPSDKFNPEYHEALLMQESDKEKNTILEVLQKGYTLNKILVRHAKVKLSK